MSLMNLLAGHERRPSAPRRRHTFRPSLAASVEGLEDRLVLNGPGTVAAAVSTAAQTPVLSIDNLNVTNLQVTGPNSLLATLDLSGTLLGRDFSLNNLQLPINVGLDTSGPCPILHLSLEIEDLNLLGLHVELNDCKEGPVTVDVTAIPTGQEGGGLLGDLLCGVGNLLGGTGGLLNLGDQTGAVTGALTQVLNGVLGGLLGGGGGGSGGGGGGQSSGIPADACPLVSLDVPSGIDLNVFGLDVNTSGICLDVYAQHGQGVLGDLLCNVNNLLSRNNPGNAVNALVTNALRAIDRLNA